MRSRTPGIATLATLALVLVLAGAAPALAQSRQPASVWREVLGRGGVRVDDRDSDGDSDRDSDRDSEGGRWGGVYSDGDSDSDSDGGAWGQGNRRDDRGWDVWHGGDRPGRGRASGRGRWERNGTSVRDVILGRRIDGDLLGAHDAWHARNGAWSADPRWTRAHDDLHRGIDREMRLRMSRGARSGLSGLLPGWVLGRR